MLHELLLAMLGHTGQLFVRRLDGRIDVDAQFPHLHPAERSQLADLAQLGAHYLRLSSWQPAHASVYARAVAVGTDSVLDQYRATVAAAEQAMLRDPHTPLASVMQHFDTFQVLLPRLVTLVDNVSRQALQGGALLTELAAAATSGAPTLRDGLSTVLAAVRVSMLRHVVSWCVHGTVNDVVGEFFIDPQKECLRTDQIPSFLPHRVAAKVLFIGRAVRILGQQQAARTDLQPSLRAFTSGMQAMQTRTVFDFAEFNVVVETLRHATAQRLWSLVVDQARLPAHLSALKSYFLLARGELWHTLLQELPTLTAPDLNRFLSDAALSSCGLDEDDVFFRRLRLVRAEDPPGSPEEEAGLPPVQLQYQVEWPVSLLITEPVLQRYNRLFRFLLQVRRAQTHLQQQWSVLQHGGLQRNSSDKQKQADAQRVHRQHLLRSQMSFLLDNLQYYLLADVLEVQWERLMARLAASDDFEDIQRAHDDYLASITSQCFLYLRPVAVCLQRVFKLCLSFPSQDLAGLERDFARQNSFLFTVLSSIRSQTSSAPNLQQLLLRIDYNRYFSMRKTQSSANASAV